LGGIRPARAGQVGPSFYEWLGGGKGRHYRGKLVFPQSTLTTHWRERGGTSTVTVNWSIGGLMLKGKGTEGKLKW